MDGSLGEPMLNAVPSADLVAQHLQERDGGRPVGLVVKLGEGDLRGTIDPDVEVELPSSVRTSAISMWK